MPEDPHKEKDDVEGDGDSLEVDLPRHHPPVLQENHAKEQPSQSPGYVGGVRGSVAWVLYDVIDCHPDIIRNVADYEGKSDASVGKILLSIFFGYIESPDERIERQRDGFVVVLPSSEDHPVLPPVDDQASEVGGDEGVDPGRCSSKTVGCVREESAQDRAVQHPASVEGQQLEGAQPA